jgi:hypothetical protein
MESPVGYQGTTANIPLGAMGIMSDVAPGTIPPTALIKAYDVDFGPGFIQKGPGSLRYNLTVLPAPIVALTDYWPNVYTQRMFAATSAGNIYRDIGDRTFTGATAVATGLGALTTRAQFVIAGNEVAGSPKKIFFFSDGVKQAQVLSGDTSTFADIATPATDWVTPNFPKFGLTHRNQLWAFQGTRYYASLTSSHETFTGAGTLSGTVGPGDGGDITAAYVYKGKMLIFKEGDVVYFLNDSDSDQDNWYFAKLGEGFGIASPHAAVQVLDDLLIGNNTGSVTSYAATQKYGDIASADIFRQAQVNQFFRENTSFSGFPYMHTLWYPEKHMVMFTARTMANTKNNALIMLDVQNPSAPRYSLNKRDQADCLALRKDIYNVKRPMYGSADGYVYLMDREDRLVGGSAFTGEFKTPHLDFRHLDQSLSHKNKTFDFLGVTFQEEGQHNLSVDVFIDGQFSQTVTFPQTIATNYMGTAVMGTSKMGIEDEKTIWKPINGTGRRISFRCYNSGSNENFKVSQLTVGFTVTGEDATRLSAT